MTSSRAPGILLNNMLGEDDLHPGGFHAARPGVRVASMMAPTVVLDGADRAELVLGSGGSKRIRTAILQVVSAVVDGGATVEEAVTGAPSPLGHRPRRDGAGLASRRSLGALGAVAGEHLACARHLLRGRARRRSPAPEVAPAGTAPRRSHRGRVSRLRSAGRQPAQVTPV